MAKKSKNTAMAEAIRAQMLAGTGIPTPEVGGGFVDLSAAGKALGDAFKDPTRGEMPLGYETQRAGEREDLRQFPDEDEFRRIGIQNAISGSKKFTLGEIRRGYRKL